MASTRDGLTFCDHGPITFVAQEAQDGPVTKETHDAGQAFRSICQEEGCASGGFEPPRVAPPGPNYPRRPVSNLVSIGAPRYR